MLTKSQVNEIRGRYMVDDERLPRVFSVLGDPSRWRLFRLLSECDDLCVSDLAAVLDVSVPAVSQQLRVMEMSGLIRKERMGQKICYRVRTEDPVPRFIVRMIRAIRKLRT